MKKLLFSLLYVFAAVSGVMCQTTRPQKKSSWPDVNNRTFLHYIAEHCNNANYYQLVTKDLTSKQMVDLYDETDPRLKDIYGNKAYDIAYNNYHDEILKALADKSYNHDGKNRCENLLYEFNRLEDKFNKKEALEKQQKNSFLNRTKEAIISWFNRLIKR